MDRRWLDWAQRLQAISQTGLAFGPAHYDAERYSRVGEIAAEILAAGACIDLDRARRLFAPEAAYSTPAVDVRGAVFRDDELLLVREASDGLWTLPGGWADVGESPAQNVVREIEEESGFQTRTLKLIAVHDKSRRGHLPPQPRHAYKLLFLCEIVGGAPRISAETSAVDFFTMDALPPLSTARITAAQLHLAFTHHRDPSLPTDFD